VIRFLRMAVAFHYEQEGLITGTGVAGHGGTRPRANLIPDFPPDYAGRLAKRPRMLAARMEQ
jgi:hypothetical protein